MSVTRLKDLTFVAVDTETTGSSARRNADRIVELAAVRFTLDGISATWERTIWPHRPIGYAAQRVHGISLDDLHDAPCFHEIVDDFLAFVQGAIVVMHNAPFDCAFLGVQLGEVVRSWQPQIFDTLRILRRRFHLPSNSLTAATRHFRLPSTPMHRAVADAMATANLFLHLLPQLGSPLALHEIIPDHGPPCAIPSLAPCRTAPELEQAARNGTPVAVQYGTRTRPMVGRIEGIAIGERSGYCTLRLTDEKRLHLITDRIVSVRSTLDG